jgi:phosphonate transport system permease protein
MAAEQTGLDISASEARKARFGWVPPVLYTALTIGALVWALGGIEITPERLARGGPQIVRLFSEMFAPPDWSFTPKLLIGLRESIQIAALGTFFAALLAIPFGVLAARNLTRLAALPLFGKLLLNLIRTFPELLLAIAFVKAVGLGPFAGVLAIAIHSIGMMGKLYAERIETVDKGAIEALAASGASPIEVFRHGILPEVLPDFLSFALYRFDLNVRSASVLGLVGAGGIGRDLLLQKQGSKWDAVGMIVLGIIVTVAVVDFVSAKLRARLT